MVGSRGKPHPASTGGPLRGLPRCADLRLPLSSVRWAADACKAAPEREAGIGGRHLAADRQSPSCQSPPAPPGPSRPTGLVKIQSSEKWRQAPAFACLGESQSLFSKSSLQRLGWGVTPTGAVERGSSESARPGSKGVTPTPDIALRSVALLVFLTRAARAGIIAAHFFGLTLNGPGRDRFLAAIEGQAGLRQRGSKDW